MNEKISIIIPVYNVEKYLKQCIESVLNQTYKNLEIILVNDGSSDNSGKICDAYKEQDSRIKVIHQKNQGLSGARNTGLENITGNYISFIDSDDFVDNKMYEKMLSNLKAYDADIIECGVIFCDEERKVIRKSIKKNFIYEGKFQIKELISSGNITSISWGKIYKKKLFKNVRFPLGKYHEDVFTTYKLLHLANKTIVLDENLYYYRQVKGSITNSKFNIKHLDSIKAVLERKEFIEKYYPEYKKYDYCNIVHSCCLVYEKMILAKFYDEKIVNKIQFLIRKYLINLLFNKKLRKSTKMFAIICAINMTLCKNVYLVLFEAKK